MTSSGVSWRKTYLTSKIILWTTQEITGGTVTVPGLGRNSANITTGLNGLKTAGSVLVGTSDVWPFDGAITTSQVLQDGGNIEIKATNNYTEIVTSQFVWKVIAIEFLP